VSRPGIVEGFKSEKKVLQTASTSLRIWVINKLKYYWKSMVKLDFPGEMFLGGPFGLYDEEM
jgi:hypothetical protein